VRSLQAEYDHEQNTKAKDGQFQRSSKEETNYIWRYL
jgi:hypothetical protein